MPVSCCSIMWLGLSRLYLSVLPAEEGPNSKGKEVPAVASPRNLMSGRRRKLITTYCEGPFTYAPGLVAALRDGGGFSVRATELVDVNIAYRKVATDLGVECLVGVDAREPLNQLGNAVSIFVCPFAPYIPGGSWKSNLTRTRELCVDLAKAADSAEVPHVVFVMLLPSNPSLPTHGSLELYNISGIAEYYRPMWACRGRPSEGYKHYKTGSQPTPELSKLQRGDDFVTVVFRRGKGCWNLGDLKEGVQKADVVAPRLVAYLRGQAEWAE